MALRTVRDRSCVWPIFASDQSRRRAVELSLPLIFSHFSFDPWWQLEEVKKFVNQIRQAI